MEQQSAKELAIEKIRRLPEEQVEQLLTFMEELMGQSAQDGTCPEEESHKPL